MQIFLYINTGLPYDTGVYIIKSHDWWPPGLDLDKKIALAFFAQTGPPQSVGF